MRTPLRSLPSLLLSLRSILKGLFPPAAAAVWVGSAVDSVLRRSLYVGGTGGGGGAYLEDGRKRNDELYTDVCTAG